jgi:two-component system sensor histidine kinase ChvG
LSRTAESGLEWLVKQRRDLLSAVLIVLSLAVLVSLFFSLLITRPLSRMKGRLESGVDSDLRLREIAAPAEIHTLGAALDERTAQLQEKSRYIGEFAANVSHELKTPLTSIRGAVELLQDQDSSMSEQQRSRFLANIEAAVARTDRLVSRLLQLARLETRGDLDDEHVNVVQWCVGLRERYASDVEIDDAQAAGAKCSLSSLEAIVTNLVDNALRYRRRAPVQVRLELQGDTLHIHVRDDGHGISADNQKHLFERFFTTERDRGGTGLGLAIVLATAQRRGGDVTLDSAESGTQVHAWLKTA